MGSRKLEWAKRGDYDRIGRVEREGFGADWPFEPRFGIGTGALLEPAIRPPKLPLAGCRIFLHCQ